MTQSHAYCWYRFLEHAQKLNIDNIKNKDFSTHFKRDPKGRPKTDSSHPHEKNIKLLSRYVTHSVAGSTKM